VQTLSADFSPSALEIVEAAYLGQDHWLRGQICHPEYHFDQNVFAKIWAYMGVTAPWSAWRWKRGRLARRSGRWDS
jgi:hypothetical protein